MKDMRPSVKKLRRQRGHAAYIQGLCAEEAVGHYYRARGHILLDQRWRGAGGEIDLVFQHGSEIVFVEVKSSATHAQAAASLQHRQMLRLFASAEDYIGQLPKGMLTPMRLDVALVDHSGAVQVIENALMDFAF